MKTLFTLVDANALLPLVRSIAAEIVERRNRRTGLAAARRVLERSETPEGLRTSLADLDAEIYGHDEGLRSARRELAELGLEVLREVPLTIGFPTQDGDGHDRLLIWRWRDEYVTHGPSLHRAAAPIGVAASRDGEAA